MSHNTELYEKMTQDQLIAKLTDDSTSSEEVEKIMVFLAKKDSEAQQDREQIEVRLKEQENGPQIGEGLTGVHNALDNMSKVVNEYTNNNEERMDKWDLVHVDYKKAVLEMLDLYRQRTNLLYSVKVSLKDTADTLIPNMELDPTKDRWEEMKRTNKEVEDTEAAFRKEMEKVSDFSKAFHEMPEYKELTAKLEEVQNRINGYQLEYKTINETEDKDQEKAIYAIKNLEEAGKKI